MTKEVQSSRYNHPPALLRMLASMRAAHTAADRMDEAFVSLLGVNRTDGRCLDIIHQCGRLPLGELGTRAGLTSGAVTALVDRLEKAGYVRRVRDPGDRRRIYVELTELTNTMSALIYGRVRQLADAGLGRMSEEEMAVIARFHTVSATASQAMAAMLVKVAASGGSDAAGRKATAEAFDAEVAANLHRLEADIKAAWQTGGAKGDPGGHKPQDGWQVKIILKK